MIRPTIIMGLKENDITTGHQARVMAFSLRSWKTRSLIASQLVHSCYFL